MPKISVDAWKVEWDVGYCPCDSQAHVDFAFHGNVVAQINPEYADCGCVALVIDGTDVIFMYVISMELFVYLCCSELCNRHKIILTALF